MPCRSPPPGDRARWCSSPTPEPGVRAQHEALRRRYGLTRAEAAFALEIVKGGGRRATAERLGITDGTARSHLSKIFDKTGVSRQAELVRLLLQK
jgi:DNA-binding CsgD family transcriptional regulator